MLIASKYEEIHPPIVEDFSYITDRSYTKEDILRMEFRMLEALNFSVAFPTCNRFMERFFQLASISHDSEACHFAEYLA